MLGTQKNEPGGNVPLATPADRVPPPQGEIGVSYQPTETFWTEGFTRFALKQDRLNDPLNVNDNRIPLGGTPAYATHHVRAGG